MDGDPLRAFADDLARDPFMRDHVGLVVTGTQKFLRPYDVERQADGAKNAVAMALRGWKPGRAKFSTYLYGAFRWARVDAARRYRLDLRDSGKTSLDAIEGFDVAAPPYDPSASSQVSDLLDRLDPRRRDVIERRYFRGHTPAPTGRAPQASAARARQIVAEALEEMRSCAPS